MRDFRQQFPFFASQAPSIYFDNAATTQKPQCVIDAIEHANIHQSANVHRSSYQLAASVTDAYESARDDVAQLINAPNTKQVFWSKGATESLNLLAHGLGELCRIEHALWQGDEIIILTSEHHANILPWQQLVSRLSPMKKLRVTPVSPDSKGNFDYTQLRDAISERTAIVAIAHVSNALGCIHPIAQITQWAHRHNALCIVDGTQAVAHIQVDVQALQCDAYVGSSHKMFGPTGVGFGYATHAILDALPPYQVGGEMIEYVSFDEVRYQSYPLKFEAGTPNISGVIGMGAAARFIKQQQTTIQSIEDELLEYLTQQLQSLPVITILGDNHNERVSLCSLLIAGVSHYDILRLLDDQHIAVRVGHHCAMPLMQHLHIDGTLRVSLCAYNTRAEIDVFMTSLHQAIMTLTASSEPAGINRISPQSRLHSDSDSHSQSESHVQTTLPLAQAFLGLTDYSASFRQIMLSAKECPILQETMRTPQYHVAGCEVDVWLANQNGQFAAFTTSKIIKGLLAILLEKANQLPVEERRQFDFAQYLATLGISHHLSQSRVDGLTVVIEQLSV